MIYKEWVKNELSKIPKICQKRDKHYTLKYLLKNINKNTRALEFGVFKGGTINIISNHVEKVYGFDSFEGLPEAWDGVVGKGYFKVEKLPKVKKNVELIQGWYNDTLDSFLKNHPEDFNLIHIDCDLYSSTKYVFVKLIEYNKLKPGVIIVFDEIINYNNFMDGELKALYEINVNNNINFEWLGAHGNVIYPKNVKKDWTFKQYRQNGYQQEAAIQIL